MSWNEKKAQERIDTYYNQVSSVEIKEYTRQKDFESIPRNQAYRVDGVHIYVEITNFYDILNSTDFDGTTCHKRAMRFLDLHQRAIHRILKEDGVTKIDFNGSRLHAIVTKPYNSEQGAEQKRIEKAVALADMIINVLAQTNDTDEYIDDAVVRVGIDSGLSLAVNNGRRGGIEPLFIGSPANKAAKLAAKSPATGIFLTDNAQEALDLSLHNNKMLKENIESCKNSAALSVDIDDIVSAWKEDAGNRPLGAYTFHGHTPPMSGLDIDQLTYKNARRQDMVSIYADLDGFTAYVDQNMNDDESAQDVVKALHVIRSELDAVLAADFQGRKIRFIGDCIHGVLAEGKANDTDTETTISTSTLAAAAMRSSFNLAVNTSADKGLDVDSLGLAIGYEYGPVTITRLGLKGALTRCCMGRSVFDSESAQRDCNGKQTSIGENALNRSSDSVKALYNKTNILADLDYERATYELKRKSDAVVEAMYKQAYESAPAIMTGAFGADLKPHASQ